MTEQRHTKRYILHGHDPVPFEGGLLAWGCWMETADRAVQQDDIGPFFVSTVFLGIDHRFHGDGPPLLFETGVFTETTTVETWGGKALNMIGLNDSWMEHCSTWDEAVEQHRRGVEHATKQLERIRREIGDDWMQLTGGDSNGEQ